MAVPKSFTAVTFTVVKNCIRTDPAPDDDHDQDDADDDHDDEDNEYDDDDDVQSSRIHSRQKLPLPFNICSTF